MWSPQKKICFTVVIVQKPLQYCGVRFEKQKQKILQRF